MQELQREVEDHGGSVAFNSRVVSGSTTTSSGRMQLRVKDTVSGDETVISARTVVNSAGLGAQQVASSIEGLDRSTIPKRHLAKGTYFSLTGEWRWSQR